MPEATLTALDGSNPLGFLAALGVLAVEERMLPSERPRLSWTTGVIARPVLHGLATAEHLVDAVMQDRQHWFESAVLDFPPEAPARDVKLDATGLRAWLKACAGARFSDGGRALSLVAALVAEGSYTGDGKAKPTDLHFTAGQQQFLEMARRLRDELTADHVEEALTGPWRYESQLPSFKWDVADDRTYALSAVNPASEQKLTVPGAEWLALMGLTFLPVARGRGRTRTTGCSGSWKQGAFSWPLWEDPLTADEVRTLLSLGDLIKEEPSTDLAARGVVRVLRSMITRSDQGGYGSFRPPRVVLDSGTLG